MTVSDKIKHFYDTVKIDGVSLPQQVKMPLSIAISAAAVSVLIGAALIIPNIVKKQPKNTGKKPISGRTV